MVRILSMSKVFDRGKTVVPAEVRSILGIGDEEDSIVWIQDEKRIYVTSSESAESEEKLFKPHWIRTISKEEAEKEEKRC